MKVDENVFEKFKETEKHVIYLEKKRKYNAEIDIIVYDKITNCWMKSLLTDALFKYFFKPEEYRRVYKCRQRQR